LDIEEPIRTLKRVVQGVQNVTKIGARLWLLRIRPELEREVLAGLRRVAVEEEIREE
jgi:hypothetical protein